MNLCADEYDITDTDDFDAVKTDGAVKITCEYKGTFDARDEVID